MYINCNFIFTSSPTLANKFIIPLERHHREIIVRVRRALGELLGAMPVDYVYTRVSPFLRVRLRRWDPLPPPPPRRPLASSAAAASTRCGAATQGEAHLKKILPISAKGCSMSICLVP